MGTDLIVEKVDLHAFFCLRNERVLEPPPYSVVLYDEEIHEDVVLGRSNGAEESPEGFLAVDQKLQLVSPGEGEAAQDLRRTAKGIFGLDFIVAQSAVHIFRQFPKFRVFAPSRPDVAGEAASSRNPIKRKRDPRC